MCDNVLALVYLTCRGDVVFLEEWCDDGMEQQPANSLVSGEENDGAKSRRDWYIPVVFLACIVGTCVLCFIFVVGNVSRD